GLIAVDLDDYIENNFIPDLQNIKPLSDFFTFTYVHPGKILIRAKYAGEKYTTTITHNTSAITLQSTINGVDAVRRPNFTIAISVFYAPFGSTIFKEIEYLPHPIGNKVSIDIADEIKHLHTTIWPSVGGAQFLDVSNMVLKYFLRYGEAYGTPLEYFQQTKSPTRYLLPGGRSKTDIRKNGSFITWMNGTSKWLTHRLTRKVSPTEPIFLYYMPLVAQVNRIRIKLFFE